MKSTWKSDEGILLYETDGKSGSRKIDIFTPNNGRKIFYVPKNIINKNGPGGLLPFSYIRFSYTENDEQSLVNQYESQKIFHIMNLSYEDLNAWYYFIEVVQTFYPLNAVDQNAFRILLQALVKGKNKNHRVVVLIAIFQLLQESGFFSQDINNIPLSDEGIYLLNACLSYDWQEDFPLSIKKETCKEIISFMERWILTECDVTLKMSGLLVI